MKNIFKDVNFENIKGHLDKVVFLNLFEIM